MGLFRRTRKSEKPEAKATGNALKATKRVPVGRTLKTKDKYLPSDKKKEKNPKGHRWVVVIDKNTKEELAIVRLTTEKQPNTTALSTYKKGNNKETRFKNFVEIEDNEGNRIKVDGIKFVENDSKYDLQSKEVSKIKDTVLKHSKQSSENIKKIKKLKEDK